MAPKKRSASPARTTTATTDSEFEGRDATGLQPKETAKTEAWARSFYFNLLGKLIFLQAPFFAWGSYFLLKYVTPSTMSTSDKKLAFIYEYQIGYVYAAWFVIYLTRMYVMINANGARAAARLDRPDQHIYKIMAETGPLAGAPYVLLATTGAAGRFNRAQRAALNMDEGLPLFLSATLLAGSVFGPLVVGLALLNMYGRVTFANGYKASLAARGGGFLAAAASEHVIAGLVGLCAVKGILGPLVPF